MAAQETRNVQLDFLNSFYLTALFQNFLKKKKKTLQSENNQKVLSLSVVSRLQSLVFLCQHFRIQLLFTIISTTTTTTTRIPIATKRVDFYVTVGTTGLKLIFNMNTKG